MAQFTEDLQNFRPLSFPFLDNIDPSMELINQFIGLNNTHVMENSSHVNMQSLMPLSCDSFFGSDQEPQFQGNLEESTFQSLVHDANNSYEVPVSSSVSNFQAENEIHEGKKRKAIIMDVVPATSSANSTPASSDNGSRTKNGFGRGKRVKSSVKEDEKKPKEVVHVRARRGQATDSHSIAERVRRGKINEKLKCLQNIVPGCYKTMGMAVMLDEIINYVQSLQNQVEFLSLKLTAASTFYDFNSETDDLETMQRARASNAKELAKYGREGYGGASCFQPSWPL